MNKSKQKKVKVDKNGQDFIKEGKSRQNVKNGQNKPKMDETWMCTE